MPCPLANSSSSQQHSLNLIFYHCSHTPMPLGATATQHLMPTFVPSLAAAQGLDMLAAAAKATTDDPLLTPAANLLSNPGPFNPPALLPPKVAKRILDLEFVEMSEVTVDNDFPQTPGCPLAPARLPFTDISQWLEHYSLMAALLVSPTRPKNCFPLPDHHHSGRTEL